MFGYIKPNRPNMLVKEHEAYKAVYCGLCNKLGKKFGFWARFTLSYDFTFFAVLGYEFAQAVPEFYRIFCPMKPLKKCAAANNSEVLDLTANFAMIMLYYKALDNIKDNNLKDKLKSILIFPLLKSAFKRAKNENPQIAQIAEEMFARQAQIEDANSPVLDEACEPSAAALGKILAIYAHGETQKRIAERLGYLLGRYIYICDAADDMEDDKKDNNYNPLLNSYYQKTKESGEAENPAVLKTVRENARLSLNLTIAEAAATAQLLEDGTFSGIIHNVLYDGLILTAEEIFGKGSMQDERPI